MALARLSTRLDTVTPSIRPQPLRALLALLGLAPVLLALWYVMRTAPTQSPATWALWWAEWWREFGPLPALAGVVIGFIWPRRTWAPALGVCILIGLLFAAVAIVPRDGTSGAPLTLDLLYPITLGGISAAPTTMLGGVLGSLAGWRYRSGAGDAEFSPRFDRRWWMSRVAWFAIAVVVLLVGLLLAMNM